MQGFFSLGFFFQNIGKNYLQGQLFPGLFCRDFFSAGIIVCRIFPANIFFSAGIFCRDFVYLPFIAITNS